ncbi:MULTISPECIES: dTDP-4-dehydrorhamnose 3,5-epimerase [Thiorhodovibrio]|uniref:dTDP-4-dehydrorhamnose 3,5-epimerase n=1 Tax=Thiorhodovibrio TaxID=61593 RepID=UPI001913D82E|nr:dTDP-4-dehydrorhamnose 3,5-epimerase [Thiorhodovibrio litoralis]MBK5967694.1 dTDP-4-dehydrorhamnose 3,5-epimerase [Thiorhodovibrio winogradskyi]WPL11642.1 dTDP-4-dehydrorhamnose 3,5-epimerase [Thiorhodovibrio litoralis]
MNVITTPLPGVLIIEPQVFGDERGFFLETWQQERYAEAGIGPTFVQDNLAYSRRGVLRGLHLQNPYAQGKLVQVLRGEVFDVAVDVRRGSPSFGRWHGCLLSEENKHQFWVPAGFAHGYLVTAEDALFSYKCTDSYHPETQFSVRWDDPAIGIDWPLSGPPTLSDADRNALPLAEIAPERLPLFKRPART